MYSSSHLTRGTVGWNAGKRRSIRFLNNTKVSRLDKAPSTNKLSRFLLGLISNPIKKGSSTKTAWMADWHIAWLSDNR